MNPLWHLWQYHQNKYIYIHTPNRIKKSSFSTVICQFSSRTTTVFSLHPTWHATVQCLKLFHVPCVFFGEHCCFYAFHHFVIHMGFLTSTQVEHSNVFSIESVLHLHFFDSQSVCTQWPCVMRYFVRYVFPLLPTLSMYQIIFHVSCLFSISLSNLYRHSLHIIVS